MPSHAELSTNDFTLSIDTHEHNHIRVDGIETIIHSREFKTLSGQGASAKGSPWLKVEWDKNKVTDEKFIINDFSSQAYEDFYLIKDNQVLASYSSGYTERFDMRPIEHFKFVADVSEADYLLVKTCCNPGVPIYFRLLNKQEINRQYYHALIWYAVVCSLISMMVMYNLFIYCYLQEKQYLMYCYYLTSMLMVLLTVSGIGEQFIWSNFSYTEGLYFLITINASISGMMFQLSFLEKRYLTAFNKKLMYCIIGSHLCALLFYFLSSLVIEIPRVMSVLAESLTILGVIITDYVIIRNIMAGDRTARILLFGYLLINIATVVFLLHYNGYWSNMLWTAHIFDVALLCEALILSLALAQKIQRLRTEKSNIEEQQLQVQRHFSKKLLQVQDEEKKQLGNILHENFAHQLLILRNKIAKKLGNNAEESQDVEKILNEIRNLSHVVHPYLLETLGLKVALTDMLDKTADIYDLDINFASDDIILEPDKAITIYRIIQESINNITKHANASECLIAIKNTGDDVSIIIKDDGDGFNPEKNKGLGLTAIDKRCQMLSGTLNIDSNEYGTILKIIFPNTRPT